MRIDAASATRLLSRASGSFNPDLRNLPTGDEGDALFLMRMQNGDGILPQERLWAIRTFVESKHIDN